MPMVPQKIDNVLFAIVSFFFFKYIKYHRLIYSRLIEIEMGKGPKHNNNKSRSNGIFKVAGQNFKTEKKGKPKEVTSKLKLVREKLQFLILYGNIY